MIDTSNMAFPKPMDLKREPQAVHVFSNGREVCNLLTEAGKAEYRRRRHEAWKQQGFRCAICSKPILFSEAVSDHKDPRGMGGARRDDRQENIQATCWGCNSEKGSKRLKR